MTVVSSALEAGRWESEEGAERAGRGVRVDSLGGERGTLIGLPWESGSPSVCARPDTHRHRRAHASVGGLRGLHPPAADCTT